MSDRPLPDDPARWPTDPHELLGVSPGVGERELRRAYHRLIRLYKPEQAPEQFRRIREAYEAVLPYAGLFGSPDEESAPQPRPAEDEERRRTQESPPAEEPLRQADLPEPLLSEPLIDSTVDAADDGWEQALAGHPAVAYAHLVQQNQQYAGRVEVYLRLYWLLTLWPELDARRGPLDVLAQGMLATGLAGPLRELYRQEVADDPGEALGERFERVLDADVQAGQLADLAEWRLLAAVRLRRWEAVGQDLRRLRLRFGPGEEEPWLRLLFALADTLAWEEDNQARDLLEECRTEIGRHAYLAHQLSHSFDRLDLLLEASAGWHQLRRQGGISNRLLRLIPVSWSRPFEEVRPVLRDALEALTGAPRRWLGYLDEARRQAPAVLALLGEALDQLEWRTPSPEPREPETLSGLVLEFLAHLNPADYDGERPELLAFCIQEMVSPEEMAEAVSGFPDAWKELGDTWAQALLNDWPLRHVYRGWRLFWA